MQGNAKISWIFDIREFEVIKETKDA